MPNEAMARVLAFVLSPRGILMLTALCTRMYKRREGVHHPRHPLRDTATAARKIRESKFIFDFTTRKRTQGYRTA